MSNPLYDGLGLPVHKGQTNDFYFLIPLNNINVSYEAFLKQASQYANVDYPAGVCARGDCPCPAQSKVITVSTLAL